MECDYSGELAGVYWLWQRVLVKDSELLVSCDRIADGPSTHTGAPVTF